MVKIKIAVISDIHANIVALNEIMKDCKNNNVDKYLFTGDLVNDLPFGNDTLKIVKQLTNYVVRGNKEEYMIDYDKHKYKWDNIQFRNTLFMYRELTRENIEYIKSLPLTLSLKFEDISILLCHGSPVAVEEEIHEKDLEKINKYAQNLEEDILIFGHTHEPIWYKNVNDKIILNAGCAGVSPFNIEEAEYVILDIHGSNLNIIKRLVKFDKNVLKELIKSSGILKEDKVLMNLTYGAIVGKGLLRYNFLKEAEELMIKRNKKPYKEEATGIYTYFKLYDDDIWLGLYNKYKNEFELCQ